jgi:hypothetical protein
MKRGAPGLSLATANIVKGWSTEVRQFSYTRMSSLWQMRETPQWMKDKRLELAPKVPGNSQMKNMRPISLYEVIRKVWTTTISKRIHRVLQETRVLHGAQNRYNYCFKSSISDTSKDNIMVWNMGVSKGVVEWFIELDDGGLSLIVTLLYVNTCALHSHQDMVPQILKNCHLKLNLKLDKERVLVVFDGLYSLIWY